MARQSPAAARSLRQWPLLIVVIGVGLGLGLALTGNDTWRVGCLVIGSSLLVGAVERLALPRNEAGLLGVRSKPFDVVVLTLGGLAVIALAILVPPGR